MIFGIIFGIVFEIIFWIVFIKVILRVIRGVKLRKNITQKSDDQYLNVLQDMNTDSKDISTHDHAYCDYCGAQIKHGKKKCPSCGAKLNK